MKRDLQLIKRILLAIEEEYENTILMNLSIEGYSMQQVANHAELLYREGLLSIYKANYAGDQLWSFAVGNLTNEGFNYLDIIRDTDELESYKHFNVFYYDHSITIGDGNKINKTEFVAGGEKGEM